MTSRNGVNHATSAVLALASITPHNLQLFQVGAPMERVAVIIKGQLMRTHSGIAYICVAMDYFTTWPETYAISNQEAATVARVLCYFFTALSCLGNCTLITGRTLNLPCSANVVNYSAPQKPEQHHFIHSRPAWWSAFIEC